MNALGSALQYLQCALTLYGLLMEKNEAGKSRVGFEAAIGQRAHENAKR